MPSLEYLKTSPAAFAHDEVARLRRLQLPDGWRLRLSSLSAAELRYAKLKCVAEIRYIQHTLVAHAEELESKREERHYLREARTHSATLGQKRNVGREERPVARKARTLRNTVRQFRRAIARWRADWRLFVAEEKRRRTLQAEAARAEREQRRAAVAARKQATEARRAERSGAQPAKVRVQERDRAWARMQLISATLRRLRSRRERVKFLRAQLRYERRLKYPDLAVLGELRTALDAELAK